MAVLLLARLLRQQRALLSPSPSPSPRSFISFFCSSSAPPSSDPPDDSLIPPIVSYPPLPPEPRRRFQDASLSSDSPPPHSPPDDSSAPGFSSDIIPPVYEAASRPRVAPLPEDRAPQQPDAPGGIGLGTRAQSRMGQRLKGFVPEDEMEIPLPTLVKLDTKSRSPLVVLPDAIRQVKAHRKARFDETVEVAVRLGVDPKRSDQLVRGAATLPHGTGKAVRVAVFAQDDEAEEAKAAGADVVGAEELIDMISRSGGKLDFDKCVATPSIMPQLSRVARILGPKGLMPNPKVGTVTKNVANAVRSLKQGRVDFRADKTGIVHAGVGKVSFSEEALNDNIAAFANAVLAAKPAGLKKTSKYAGYMLSFSVCSTMGPGIRVSIPSISQAVDNYTKMMGSFQ